MPAFPMPGNPFAIFCDPYSFVKVIIEHSISTENLKNPKAPLRLLIILRGGGEKPEIGMASVNI